MKKFFAKVKAVLEGKRGEGYIDTAVKMIIAVVIGALLLGGLVLHGAHIVQGLQNASKICLVLPVQAEIMVAAVASYFSNLTTANKIQI